MKIYINDKEFVVPERCTLNEAVDAAGLNLKGYAAAVNGAVIAVKDVATHCLQEGDKILLIKAFYGG